MKCNTKTTDAQYESETGLVDWAGIVDAGGWAVLCEAESKAAVGGVKWSEVKPSLADVAGHGGGLGLIAESLGMLCIDVDEGDIEMVKGALENADLPYVAVKSPTKEKWHVWLHSERLDFNCRALDYRGVKGELRYQRCYTCLYPGEAAAICRLLDRDKPKKADRALVDMLTAGDRSPAARRVDAPRPRGKSKRKSKRKLRRGLYYEGNRHNQLNSDVFYAGLADAPIDSFIEAAKEAECRPGHELTDADIADTVKCASEAARSRWESAAKRVENASKGKSGRLTSFRGKELLTLTAMLSLARDDGGVCYASQATIAAVAGVGLRSVDRHLRKLEAVGVVERLGARVVARRRYKSGKVWEKRVIEYRIVLGDSESAGSGEIEGDRSAVGDVVPGKGGGIDAIVMPGVGEESHLADECVVVSAAGDIAEAFPGDDGRQRRGFGALVAL